MYWALTERRGGWLGCGAPKGGLLRLYEDVENPDPELAGIPAATRFERPIEADPDLRHLTVPKLGGGQGERLQRPVLRVGRERGNRLPPAVTVTCCGGVNKSGRESNSR